MWVLRNFLKMLARNCHCRDEDAQKCARTLKFFSCSLSAVVCTSLMKVSWGFGPAVIVAVYHKENSAACQALCRGLGWISVSFYGANYLWGSQKKAHEFQTVCLQCFFHFIQSSADLETGYSYVLLISSQHPFIKDRSLVTRCVFAQQNGTTEWSKTGI